MRIGGKNAAEFPTAIFPAAKAADRRTSSEGAENKAIVLSKMACSEEKLLSKTGQSSR